MTQQAQLVIIGAGVVGAAAAYHLTQMGWNDVLVLDKGPLPHNDGSTSHAPGGVVVATHNKLMTQFADYTTKLYGSLPPYADDQNQYNLVGSLEVARTQRRFNDMIRLHGEATGYGVETHLLTAQETVDKQPFLNPDEFVGSLFIPSSAIIKGSYIIGSFLREAEKTGNARVVANTAVTHIEVKDGRIQAILTNNPDMSRIECEQALLCANIWAPAISEKIGVHVPLMAFEHQYTITNAIEALSNYDPAVKNDEIIYPTVRDLDKTLYYRQHWNTWGVGSYWHEPRAIHPRDVKRTAMHEFTPHDFEEAWQFACDIIPTLKGSELVTKFNGMFAFSVDGFPIMGESHVKGFWTACASWITHAGGVAKAIAEWMTYGEAEWDMRLCHIARFQPHTTTQAYIDTITKKNYREVYEIIHPRQPVTEPRNVRLTPFHARHQALSCEFSPFAGLELPNWYEENSRLLEKYEDQIPERSGWGAEFWSPIQGAEHLELRNNVGVMDLTGLSIIEVVGRGSAEFMNYLCTNQMDQPVGSVIYTCWLTPSGGIKRDLAVARIDHDRYWSFVGEGTLPQDLEWVQRHAPDSVTVNDISMHYAALGVWGPNAEKVLGKATNSAIDQANFPYFSAQWIEIGMVRVLALRISYIGESGWELHIPMDQALLVWDALWEAGREFGMIAAGLAAMDTMRLEKGYRLWGGDIYTEYNLYEAGMRWTAKMKKGDFIGRTATLAAKEKGIKKKLCCLTLDDSHAVLFGYEPVFANGNVIGHVTTANYGYTIGRTIAYAYLPIAYSAIDTQLEVVYFGERFPATVAKEPLFDPKMERVRTPQKKKIG